jgi:CRP-like cAMP-binding protein
MDLGCVMDNATDLSLQVQLLIKQPLFSQLTHSEINELAELLVEKQILTGEVIVKEGEPVDSVYFIAEGKEEVTKATFVDGQKEITPITTLSVNDAIGLNETGFYSISGKRTATVVAASNMILFRLSVAAFHGFALAHTHVSELMHKHAESLSNDKISQ